MPGTSSERVADAGRREPIRLVSVIAPMLNEADHVEALVADLASQDYDGPLELLVADGGSVDESVRRLTEAADRRGIPVTTLANPDRFVSKALNLCIESSGGDLIVRVDCHSRYPADYIRRCVAASNETGAENVGGVLVPRGRTLVERAVACAMDSPFGGVLWTRHGTGERVETDTVPFGAFRREVFDRIGLFDESFVRNQDDEFNLRLRLAGGRIVLDPSIRVFYVPRGTYRGLFRQYFEYGLWKPAVMRKHRAVVSLRSLVPVAFVGSIGALAALGMRVPRARSALGAELILYGAGLTVFGVRTIRAHGERQRLLPLVGAAFATFHLAYGLGTLRGWAREARRRPTGSGARTRARRT